MKGRKENLKQRKESDEVRSKHGLMLGSVALIAMMLLPSVAQAYVYSGYDKSTLKWLWFTMQTWELWVKIDTNSDTWNVKWKTGTWPNTPQMYCPFISYVKMWDDKDFYLKWYAHPLSGEVTLEYSNTYTWTHTELRWVYAPHTVHIRI